jgi:nucleoside-diphosphate-sugar epimerase
MLDGETPTIYGDGEQTRDFTYVANAVQANLRAAEHADEVSGEIFNVGCGERISLNQLYAGLQEHTGLDPDAEYGPERPGDVRDSLADIERARTQLGYEPDIHISEGLSRTVEWFREHLDN